LKSGDRFGDTAVFAEALGETPREGAEIRRDSGETLPGRYSSSDDEDDAVFRSRVAVSV
jgi:hypothetical protein